VAARRWSRTTLSSASSTDGRRSGNRRPSERAAPARAAIAPCCPVHYFGVFGVTPAGQLRRGFQAYLENERAAPFRTFLHYNSWYDIGYFTPYTEAEALAVVRQPAGCARGHDL